MHRRQSRKGSLTLEVVRHALVPGLRPERLLMDWSVPSPLTYPPQHQQTACKYSEWNPELYVSEHRRQHRATWKILRTILSHRIRGGLWPPKDYMQSILIAKFSCPLSNSL
jgi:hypothetical protein